MSCPNSALGKSKNESVWMAAGQKLLTKNYMKFHYIKMYYIIIKN